MPVDPCHEFPCVVEQLPGHGKKYPPAGAYPPIDCSGFCGELYRKWWSTESRGNHAVLQGPSG